MNLRTLTDIDVSGKTVLLRTDFNVPIQNGVVQDITRLSESLPTIKYLLENGTKIVICSHLGRPKGQFNPEFSLKPVADVLAKLLGREVIFLNDCIGENIESAIASANFGSIFLLENLRFHSEEEANDPQFAAALARGKDLYVSDAFGTVHRAHASTVGVTTLLPSCAGFLLQKEVDVLGKVLENPEKPVALLVGGAKIDTKIGILEKFLSIADLFVIGGALANTFLVAQNKAIGTSLYEAEKVEVARSFLERAKALSKTVLLPIDVRIAADVTPEAVATEVAVDAVPSDMKILDLGTRTCELYRAELLKAKTVSWNGPMGLYETPAFSEGTKAIATAVAQVTGLGGVTILGGGGTLDAVHYFGFDATQFSHLSTGGGAMLEFLEGKDLPGVTALI